MTTRKELMELASDLSPTDEDWIEKFLERLKEKDPVIYGHMMAAAKQRHPELKDLT
jgi:MoaA/NifB/PqqE/SkfB family radical SAM enzyme